MQPQPQPRYSARPSIPNVSNKNHVIIFICFGQGYRFAQKQCKKSLSPHPPTQNKKPKLNGKILQGFSFAYLLENCSKSYKVKCNF